MKAELSDVASLVQMRIAYLEADLGKINEDDKIEMQKVLPDYFKKHLNRDLFAFIEKSDDVVIAMALLLVIEKPSSPNFINGKVGDVLSVYTIPKYRNRGISTKLMNELLRFGSEMELDYIELLATEEGYSLYKKIGFNDHKSNYTSMRWYK